MPSKGHAKWEMKKQINNQETVFTIDLYGKDPYPAYVEIA